MYILVYSLIFSYFSYLILLRRVALLTCWFSSGPPIKTLVTFSKNKGVIPTSCLRMLMDVGVDLDFIELFGLLLKLSYVTFAIAFLMSLLVVLFCWQLCQLLIISLNPT